MDVSGARNKSDGQQAQVMGEKDAGNEVLNENHETSLVSAENGLLGLACALPTASAELESSNLDVSSARNQSDGQLSQAMEEKDAGNEVLNEKHETSLVSAESGLFGLACALPTVSGERECSTITHIINEGGVLFNNLRDSPVNVTMNQIKKDPEFFGELFPARRQMPSVQFSNKTLLTVRVELTDSLNSRATQILNPNEECNFPTGLPKISVAAYRQNPDGTFHPNPEAEIAMADERYFTLEETDGALTFNPGVPGVPFAERRVLRNTNNEIVNPQISRVVCKAIIRNIQNLYLDS